MSDNDNYISMYEHDNSVVADVFGRCMGKKLCEFNIKFKALKHSLFHLPFPSYILKL